MQLDFDIIRNFFTKQPVVKAWLFGSFARGDQNDQSDVDIIVVFDEKAKVSLFDHIAIMQALEKILKISVDLVTAGTLHPLINEQAEKDKILIYERTT